MPKPAVQFDEESQAPLDKTAEKDMKKYEDETYSSLIKQVQDEYKLAERYLTAKLSEWLVRLKLYNNQRRDKEAVGDPLLFTVFQTILASLYLDQLTVSFDGRQEGDSEKAETLNSMAKFDYDEMGKDIFDYDWMWDSMFFGRGISYLDHFSKEAKTMIPDVQDPTTFLRDPRSTSINGNRLGRNACRFFGRPIRMTKSEMKKMSGYVDIDDDLSYEITKDSLIEKARQARSDAQNTNHNKNEGLDLGDNTEYELLEWHTFWKGKRVLVCLANDMKKLVRFKVLEEQRWWRVEDRALYPIAHDWDSVSIPDLVEDKQRARAVTQNLTLAGMKAKLHPMYIFDSKKIKNKHDLSNFQFNKFIPAEGDPYNAVIPIQRDVTDMGVVRYIMDSLDAAAQRATSTPEMQQGSVSSEKRTLGELNLVASRVDTRYSLSAKIFGWSEKRFWRQWYWMYHKHFKNGIHEKMVRIEGAYGAKWKGLKRSDFIGSEHPDIRIESKVVSDQKRMNTLATMTPYFSFLMNFPDSNRRYAIRKLGVLHGLEKDEMERLIPKNIDERQAEWENGELEDGRAPQVKPSDNHQIHLEIHSKAPDTEAAYAHIKTHEEALRLQKENPELFPEEQRRKEEEARTGEVMSEASKGMQGNAFLAPSQSGG
jgi:hypothetical protein